MESDCKRVMRENVLALLAYRQGLPLEKVGVSKLIALGLPNGTAHRRVAQDHQVGRRLWRFHAPAAGHQIAP